MNPSGCRLAWCFLFGFTRQGYPLSFSVHLDDRTNKVVPSQSATRDPWLPRTLRIAISRSKLLELAWYNSSGAIRIPGQAR